MKAERRTLIKHNDKNIIYNDFSNLEGPEFVQVVGEVSLMAQSNTISERLVLVNATNSVMDKMVLNAIKSMTAKSSGQIHKTAVFGVSGIQLFFMRTISKFSKINLRAFETRDEALAWLTSDDEG